MSFKLKPDMYLIKVVGASKEKIVFSSEHNGAKKILKTTCLCPLDCVHYNMAKNTNYKSQTKYKHPSLHKTKTQAQNK